MCSTGKKAYHTHDAAMRVAHRQMGRRERVVLQVYKCRECHEWHLTSRQNMPTLQVLKFLRMRREVDWP